MDDDTFQQFIVYDEGESDEHSNDKYIRKQPKITDDQLGKLIAAMNGNEEVDAEMFKKLWDNLVVELNEIGPPTYSAKEWRKVWSNYKYQSKNRRMSIESGERVDGVDQGSAAVDVKYKTLKGAFESFQQQVLEALGSVVQNQKQLLVQQQNLIANQNRLIDKMDLLLNKLR